MHHLSPWALLARSCMEVDPQKLTLKSNLVLYGHQWHHMSRGSTTALRNLQESLEFIRSGGSLGICQLSCLLVESAWLNVQSLQESTWLVSKIMHCNLMQIHSIYTVSIELLCTNICQLLYNFGQTTS